MIGSDFYGATELLGLSDEEIVNKVVRNIQRCDPRALGAKVSTILVAELQGGMGNGILILTDCCIFLMGVLNVLESKTLHPLIGVLNGL